MKETIGERLRRLREDKGISVTVLARRARISEGAVRQLESGQNKQPNFLTGLRLAQVLGVRTVYLATGQEPISAHASEDFVLPEEELEMPPWAQTLADRLSTLEREHLEGAKIQNVALAEQQSAKAAQPKRRKRRRPR